MGGRAAVIQPVFNAMIALMMAKFTLNDVPHMLDKPSSGSFPPGYVLLGRRKLGPFRTSVEADLVLAKLDFDDEETYAGLLKKHGPAYLMLGSLPTKRYTMYHVAPVSRVSSILAYGLQVSAKPYYTAQHPGLEPYGIYLGDSASTVEGFLFEPVREPVELLEVTIPWDWTLWLDPETAEMGAYLASTAGFYISKDSIPSGWVKRAPESVKEEAERHWKWITRSEVQA